MYQSMMTLCRALAQYLLLLSKLPAGLHVPPDKEDDILKFVVMSIEVRNYTIIKGVMQGWEREQLYLNWSSLSNLCWGNFFVSTVEISSVILCVWLVLVNQIWVWDKHSFIQGGGWNDAGIWENGSCSGFGDS